jgi:succinoglycan biosynthesis transport protein ExoP
MLQRVKEAGIASALRASNIRIVDPAKIPEAPYKPSLKTNTALGLLAGLFFAVVVVVLQERADRTLQDPGETSHYLNLNELGIIPNAGLEAAAKRRLLHHSPQPTPDNLALATLNQKLCRFS